MLFLPENNIPQIPREIALLRGLVCLDLRRNEISGTLAQEITALTNLAGLDLSYNRIEQLPENFCSRLVKLQYLNLSHNQLHVQEQRTHAPVLDDIGHLSSLEYLEIGGNKLKQLPAGIGQCIRLMKLSVKDNELVELPGSIVRLVNLNSLDAQRNNLRRLVDDNIVRELLHDYESDSMQKNESVDIAMDGAEKKRSMQRRQRHVALFHAIGESNREPLTPADSYARISMAPAALQSSAFSYYPDDFDTILTDHQKAKIFFQQLERLKHLNLSHNYLDQDHVLVSIGCLGHLMSLDISSNCITGAPSSHNASRISDCDIRTTIQDVICTEDDAQLPERSTVPASAPTTSVLAIPSTTSSVSALSPTQIMGIQHELSFCPIEGVNLARNGIMGSFPSWLGKIGSWCDMLTTIDLRNNRINSMQTTSIQYLASLRFLDLSRNLIEYLPSIMFRLSSVERLNLRKNRISKIHPRVFHMKKLRELNLEYNQLRNLPKSIGRCGSLQVLELKHNCLEVLPDEISDCEKLLMLDVSHNRLTNLPRTIDRFRSLRRLLVNHNRLVSLPRELRFIETLMCFNCDHNDKLMELIQEHRWSELEDGYGESEDEIDNAEDKNADSNAAKESSKKRRRRKKSANTSETAKKGGSADETELLDTVIPQDLQYAAMTQGSEQEKVPDLSSEINNDNIEGSSAHGQDKQERTIQDVINLPNRDNCTIM